MSADLNGLELMRKGRLVKGTCQERCCGSVVANVQAGEGLTRRELACDGKGAPHVSTYGDSFHGLICRKYLKNNHTHTQNPTKTANQKPESHISPSSVAVSTHLRLRAS